MAQLAFILPRLLLAFLLGCCQGCWQGTARATRFQVASSSMAPALLGPTRSAICSSCQYTFPIAAETYRPTLPTRCPNCGGLCQIGLAIHPGQTVQMEPMADFRNVRRWDVIAFQEASSRTMLVKRVWGLPGESVELLQGEAWIDGVRLRKSLAELRRLAVPVYDLNRGGACRLRYSDVQGQNAPTASHGTGRHAGVSQKSSDASGSPLHIRAGQRVHLEHVRPARVHPRDVLEEQWLQASPVSDVYPINQGLSTADHTVTAGIISLRLQRPLDATLRINVRVAERTIRVLINPPVTGSKTDSSSGTAPMADSPATPLKSTADFRIAARQRIELGWCDGRLLIETDVQSREVEQEELETLPLDAQALQPDQFAWAPAEICRLESTLAVDISHLRFARDLYLIAADSQPAEHRRAVQEAAPFVEPSGLAAEQLDGFYVLGDNIAASRDSRHELGRVRPAQVLGRIVTEVK